MSSAERTFKLLRTWMRLHGNGHRVEEIAVFLDLAEHAVWRGLRWAQRRELAFDGGDSGWGLEGWSMRVRYWPLAPGGEPPAPRAPVDLTGVEPHPRFQLLELD